MTIPQIMDHFYYKKLNQLLEKELDRIDLPIERYANPFLHLISEHPIYAHRYEILYKQWRPGDNGNYHAGKEDISDAKTKTFDLHQIAKAARQKIPSLFPPPGFLNIKRADIVIVSVLVDPGHLCGDDFYFGPLQRFLAENNFRSILIYINQSGVPEEQLRGNLTQTRQQQKIILPTTLRLQEELILLRRLVAETSRVKRMIAKTTSKDDRQLMKASIGFKNIRETAVNLRFYESMRKICRSTNPSMLLTLYEGHVWEKLAWRAAKETTATVRCIGYQHAVIREQAYGVLRYHHNCPNMNPDAILALGSVTKKILEEKLGNKKISIHAYGSHRRENFSAMPPRLPEQKCVLVAPEGISSENIALVGFAYECSNYLPDYHFILRFHPALTVESLPQKLRCRIEQQSNISVSKEKQITSDFAKAGYIVYRGSSTVLYAIIAGLKPFYVNLSGTANIDPLFALDVWRETIDHPNQLKHRTKALENSDSFQKKAEWEEALSFCNDYIHPLNMNILLGLLNGPSMGGYVSE